MKRASSDVLETSDCQHTKPKGQHMKRKASILGALAVLGGLLLASTPASAADYSGNCASVPSSVSGNVTINDGACTLNQSITATGFIKITATSISGSTRDLTSSNSYIVVETTGNTTIANITAQSYISVKADNLTAENVKSTGTGRVLLVAQKDLGVGDVEGGTGNSINLKANAGGTNSLFTIGSTGSNAVKSITAHPSGNPTTTASTIVYVTNGTSSSTGGITWSDASKISVAATSSDRAGYIYLNARAGTLTMPTSVSLDGNATAGAGLIGLLAKEISFPASATVSASQPTGGTGTLHGVLISAETISHSGLTLKGNGDGANSTNTGYVQIFPKGAVTITDSTTNPGDGEIIGAINFGQQGDITIDGSSPLSLQANGSNSRVYIGSSKTTFSGGAVTIESKGLTNHKIQFNTTATYDGTKGVAFTGNDAVLLDASAEPGQSSTGGDIVMTVDKVTMDAPTFTASANGPSSGNGDGGKIDIQTGFSSGSGFALNATSIASFNANAASNGTGNAVYSEIDSGDPQAIHFFAGLERTIKLGIGEGMFSFSAKGGENGGVGGSIWIGSTTAVFETANAVIASATAGDSKGGTVEIIANTSYDNTITDPFITATGWGSGIGGRAVIYEHNITNFDVNKYIKVDGGDSLVIGAGNDFGRIRMNSITCQQRTTGQGDWPYAYWNCANPDESLQVELDMVTAVVGLPNGTGQFRQTLGAHNPQLYVMTSGYDWLGYFGEDIGQPIGFTNTTDFETYVSVVFEFTESTDQSNFLPGNMMHEIAHLLDAYTNTTATNGWTTKSAMTESDLKGTWPNPQSPTCMQVFNNQNLCNAYANTSPWAILNQQYMGGQPAQLELFAFAFQNCSGYPVYAAPLNTAEQSTYMRDIYDFMDQTYWPGGCYWQP